MTNITRPAGLASESLSDCCDSEVGELLSGLLGQMNLPRPQIIAIELLLCGNKPAMAARGAGVHRGTLHRWMREDAVFARALADCRIALRYQMHEQLLAMADVCREAVEAAVQNGNASIAIRMLKLMGAFDAPSVGVAPKRPGAAPCTLPAIDERSGQGTGDAAPGSARQIENCSAIVADTTQILAVAYDGIPPESAIPNCSAL